MLNAANLGWIAAYSFRKEKAAKKEVGAGARPRGGSAPAGFAGQAGADPALPAARPGRRLPLLQGKSLGCGARREGRWMRGARALAPEWRLSASPGTAATGFSSEKSCGGVAQRPRGRCGAARPAAPRGRSRRPPSTAWLSGGAVPPPRKAETPRKEKLVWGRGLIARGFGWGACEVSVPWSRGRPATRAAAPRVRARSRPRAGPSGAGGPPGEFQLRPRPAGGGEGAARVASRTLNL